MLERMRATLPDMKTPEYSAEVARLRIAELALCTSLNDDQKTSHKLQTDDSISSKTWLWKTSLPPLVARIQLIAERPSPRLKNGY